MCNYSDNKVIEHTLYFDRSGITHMIWNYLRFLLWGSHRYWLYCPGPLPAFLMRGIAKFQLKVCEKSRLFSPVKFKASWILSTDPALLGGE